MQFGDITQEKHKYQPYVDHFKMFSTVCKSAQFNFMYIQYTLVCTKYEYNVTNLLGSDI